MKLLKRFFTSVVIVIASMLVLVGCNLTTGEKPISIDMDRIMLLGEEYELNVKLLNSDASLVNWEIDNLEIAKFEGNKIIPLKEGSFNLTASIGNDKDVKHIIVRNKYSYTILYNLDGGVEDPNNPLVTTYFEGQEEVVLNAPIKYGYKFTGFFDNDELSGDAVTTVNKLKENINLWAAWELVQYPITFSLNGGMCSAELPTTRNVTDPEFVLPTLVKEGYTFAGWFDNAEFEGEAITSLNKDNLEITNLFAKYEPCKYTINYDLVGGENNPVNPNEHVYGVETILVAPTKYGYNFLGWTFEGSVIESIPADQLGEVSVVATWEIKTYPISFELNGGTTEIVLPTERTIESEGFNLPTLEKVNYDFAGWFDNAEFEGEEVITLNADNLEVNKFYAKFTPKSFNISYVLVNGVNAEENPDSYVFGTTITLAEPTKEHYSFVEWQLNGSAVTEIVAGTSGNVELVAVWELVKYTVNLNYNTGSTAKILTIDEFADEMIALFKQYKIGDESPSKEEFKAQSSKTIKNVFDKADVLAKYKWLFELMLSEMKASAGDNIDAAAINTFELVEKLIAGDTTAINGSYADGRTAIRWWLQGLMNKVLQKGTGAYNHLMSDFSLAENQQKFTDAQGSLHKLELTIEDSLPVITRDHYTFLGWFDENDNLVESIDSNCTLVAHWNAVVYDVQFDLNGGEFMGINLDKFATELVALFNSTGASDAKVTTRENFCGSTNPNIKYVFANAENLAKYKWLFEFAVSEMTANAEANGLSNYLAETVEMLNGMISGDTTAIVGNYANGRTVFRWWLEGLINSKLPTGTGLYNHLMTDFSNAENMNKFMTLYLAPYLNQQLTVENKLPEVVKEGYIFKGWFNGTEKVESVSGSMSLVAEWEIIKFDISYDLNGGSWVEGQEGVVEFEYNQNVVLPTPVKEGYTFLGWTQLSQYVTVIENADYSLVAKWKADTQTGYEVIFDLNGGSWEENLDTFAEELVALFNSTGELDAKVTTRENFKATTHPNIKYVFNKPENLAKYKWLFEFAVEEITANSAANGKTSYLQETLNMLNGMIAGDTSVIGGDYSHGRTIFRFWLEGLINNKLPIDSSYGHLLTDFSDPLNQAKFVQLYCPLELTIEPNEELPIAVKENYIFLGWTKNGQKVEFATGDDVLVASWIHEDDYEWTVNFDLDGGEWAESKNIDDFADEMIALFNQYKIGDESPSKEEFKAQSSKTIKNVFDKADVLAKYKWLFELMLSEMKASAGDNIDAVAINTFELVEKLIAGDTTAINGSYADGRTAIRWWLQGLMNKVLQKGTGAYNHLMTDFSNEQKQAEFLEAYNVFDNTYTSKEVLPTPVKDGNIFLGWLHEGELVEEVRGNWTLVASWLDTATVRYNVSYDLNGGAWAEGETPVTEFGYDGTIEFLTPVKEGYNFIGWYEGNTQITSVTNRDYALKAKWEEIIIEDEVKTLYVDPAKVGTEGYYATLGEALEAASAGDTIVLCAGEYQGVEITKAINLHGPNAGLNPNNDERLEESVFTGVILLSANNITIDGVKLTAKGQIVANPDMSLKNITITNTSVIDSSVNENNNSSTAPIYIYTKTENVVYENVELINLRFVGASGSSKRPMVLYMNNTQNLTIFNSYFEGTNTQYNDAVKIGNESGSSFGVKGNVVIKGNHFEKYAQYILWFQNFGEGNYQILDNTFKNCGKDAANHCAARFASYVGKSTDLVNIEFKYNTVNNAYSLIRFGALSNVSATNLIVEVNYNKLLNCEATFFVNSELSFKIDATNNWYDVTPTDSKFRNANWSPYIANLKDVPSYIDPEYSILIDYILNGSELPDDASLYYNKLNGMTSLPTPTFADHIFVGWFYNNEYVTSLPKGIEGDIQLEAKWVDTNSETFTIEFVTDKGSFPTRDALNREEIYTELYNDLYEWQVSLGNTKSFEEYKADLLATIAEKTDFKLRNPKLGNYPAEDGSTEYFLNIPKYFEKWSAFFAVFHNAMITDNPNQPFYTDTYAMVVRIGEFLNWTTSGENRFKNFIPDMLKAVQIVDNVVSEYHAGQIVELPMLTHKKGLEFYGWYDNADFNGEVITHIQTTDTGNKVFYASWAPEIKPESIKINDIATLERYNQHQLIWELSPINVTDNSVEFFSSNPEVASVTALTGLITAHSNGTTTITVKVYGNREIDYVFELTVYSPAHFEASYETNSYVNVDDTIKLNAKYVDYITNALELVWTSADCNIASVENGVVTGVGAGTTTIRCSLANDASVYFDFLVTVVEEQSSDLANLILNSHESNTFTKWNLNIGGDYLADVFGSVSRILFNNPLVISNEYYGDNKDALVNKDTFGVMESIDFITVHYTGNMTTGADAAANAKYFTSGSGENVSIHYTTGNDGVYNCLDDTYSAWHAGDSGALDIVGKFEWLPTGVAYDGTDLMAVQYSASDDFYFEINGKKTSVKLPTPYNYRSSEDDPYRNTDHILNLDGTYTSKQGFGGEAFADRTPESFFNDQDFTVKVIDGEYYMAKTWWCYTQVYEGRICGTGGNRNSIGMESCVDKGSDLWLTWQKTAQLVAKLMKDNNLGIERVKGHHYFSGKNCPQPLLENNLEIWKEFIELVKAEYALLTLFEGAEINIVSNNPDIVDNNGRVINIPDYTTCVSYTVTVSLNGETHEFTLSSIVQGIYQKA